MASEKPALKPFSILVFIMEKNTGPVKKEDIKPVPKPSKIASNIYFSSISVLICNFYYNLSFVF